MSLPGHEPPEVVRYCERCNRKLDKSVDDLSRKICESCRALRQQETMDQYFKPVGGVGRRRKW